jgi:hypothetical protein
MILDGDISTAFVKSRDQLPDVFTKTLCQNQVEFICSKVGLYDICSNLRGSVRIMY